MISDAKVQQKTDSCKYFGQESACRILLPLVLYRIIANIAVEPISSVTWIYCVVRAALINHNQLLRLQKNTDRNIRADVAREVAPEHRPEE